MICITGIPGSGKTTLCSKLRDHGIKCISVLEIPGAENCRNGDEVDIDCLKEKFDGILDTDIMVEGHYSHLLKCNSVIILDREEMAVTLELRNRGYSEKKINENLDALRSDVIYRETLDLMPSTRIRRIKVQEGRPEVTLNEVLDYIGRQKNKS